LAKENFGCIRKEPLPTPQSQKYEAAEAFEMAVNSTGDSKFELRLYVAGENPKSLRAIGNVRRICEEHLAGRYELEVVDLHQNPVLAKGEQIVAVPTLIRKLPVPLQKLIGDMSDTDSILVGLGLRLKTI
jgi:circadian clock protein KaiB